MRVRMRSRHGADQVVRRADGGDPVAESFADGLFQRARARIRPHAPRHRAGACDTTFGAWRRCPLRPCTRRTPGRSSRTRWPWRRHAVPRRSRRDAALTEAAREERLTTGVVDLVRAGVQEVLALEKDPLSRRREARRLVQRSRSSGEALKQLVELGSESRVRQGSAPTARELVLAQGISVSGT